MCFHVLFLFFLLWVVYLRVFEHIFPFVMPQIYKYIHNQTHTHTHTDISPHAVYIKNKYTMLEYRTFVHLKFVFMHTNDGDIFPTFSLFSLSLFLFCTFIPSPFSFSFCFCFRFYAVVVVVSFFPPYCYRHTWTLAY